MSAATTESELEEFLGGVAQGVAAHADERARRTPPPEPQPSTQNDVLKPLTEGIPVQWLLLGDDRFYPASLTLDSLPVGTYSIDLDNNGNPIYRRIRVVTDQLIRFPDTRSDAVIASIKKFWASKEQFAALGQIHKRGVLLWGPPGSGKTATLMLLCQDLQMAGGITILCGHPGATSIGLRQLRKIEADRPLICIMEDLDEMVAHHGESHLLNLLDGENQVDNVCFVATTNYPDRLDPRFVNRPSRFDEVIKIDMPSAEARRIYLESKVQDRLSAEELSQWVADTDKMSLAHLRELIVSVFAMDVPYDQVIRRLKIMRKCAFDERTFGIQPLAEKEAVAQLAARHYQIATER